MTNDQTSGIDEIRDLVDRLKAHVEQKNYGAAHTVCHGLIMKLKLLRDLFAKLGKAAKK